MNIHLFKMYLLSAYPVLWASKSFPGSSDSKESACNSGDLNGLERSLGEGNGNPLQYSYMKNSMDRGAWQATVPGVAKSHT